MDRRRHVDVALTRALFTFVCVELAAGRVYRVGIASQTAFVYGIAMLLAVSAALWLRAPRWTVKAETWSRWLGLLVVVLGGYAVYFRAIRIQGDLEHGPIVPLGVAAASGLGLALYATVRPHIRLLLVGAVVAGLALRAVELLAIRIDTRYADMIPLVILSLRLFVGGDAPYRMYHMPWDLPLTYLPLNWLAYLPTFVAGMDPRWTNAVAELAILGAVLFAGRKCKDTTARDAAAALWAAWFVSHSLVTYDGGVAGAVQWAALAWTAALMLEFSRWTPAVLGLALATTPLVIPLVPTLLVAWRRRRLRSIALAVAVASVFILPFVAWSPSDFFDGTVRWFNDLDRYPHTKWVETRAWCLYPSFSCAFWKTGLEQLLKPLQLVLVLGLALVAWRSVRRGRPFRFELGGHLVATYTLFMLVNPVVWNYLWEPARVLALVALAATRRSATEIHGASAGRAA